MDFNVSVGDENQDIRILAPWFLNCLNRLSGSNPAKFILKQQVFAQTPMNGFKADPETYQKYVDLKGSPDYTSVVEPVIRFLERNRFLRSSSVNPAKIAIGRNGAGVHYRSDYTESIRLGEQIAHAILVELKEALAEKPNFQYISFFGGVKTI